MLVRLRERRVGVRARATERKQDVREQRPALTELCHEIAKRPAGRGARLWVDPVGELERHPALVDRLSDVVELDPPILEGRDDLDALDVTRAERSILRAEHPDLDEVTDSLGRRACSAREVRVGQAIGDHRACAIPVHLRQACCL
jgi:hypothetical protein